MKLLGIEFAPVRIPFERRRQTFAVFFLVSALMFFGPLATLFLLYLLVYTQYYWLTLLYLIWYVLDRKTPEQGGRMVQWVRDWPMWKDYAAYFPVSLVKEADLNPNKNYIIGSHPHGVFCSGVAANFSTEGNDVKKVFPGIKFFTGTLSFQFSMPVQRELFLSMGGVTVSPQSLNHVLTAVPFGNAVVLVVGGAVESLETRPNANEVTLILRRRKGFAKLALQHGAHLVPTFSFGETEVYDQVKNPPGSKLRTLQDFLQKYLRFAPVLFIGRGVFQYNFGIIPHRRPIITVVGKPIEVERRPNPTEEEVNDLHSKYIRNLEDLFERHKSKYYGSSDVKLRIL